MVSPNFKNLRVIQIIFVFLLLCGSHSALAQSKFVGGYEATGGSGDLWVILQTGDLQILFGLYANLKWEALVGNYNSRTDTTVFDSVLGLPSGYELEITAYWYDSPRTGKITSELRVTSCKYYDGPCNNVRDGALVAFLSKVFDS